MDMVKLAEIHTSQEPDDFEWLSVRNEFLKFGRECDPFDSENFLEAVFEVSEGLLAELAPLLRAKKYDEVGRKLNLAVINYWTDIADKKTDEIINDAVLEMREYHSHIDDKEGRNF